MHLTAGATSKTPKTWLSSIADGDASKDPNYLQDGLLSALKGSRPLSLQPANHLQPAKPPTNK